MALQGNRVQQMVIAIAKLSLNNPSNIWHCLKEILPHNEREREEKKQNENAKKTIKEYKREKENERKKESERVGCQMLW